MAMYTRYEAIDRLPETGIQLACTPVMNNYLDVLNEAWQNNNESESGVIYNESDKPTREISYVYALNSIYRDLLQWQNNYPEDEIIPEMRQQIRDMFPYFMQNEFPLPADSPVSNFEIKEDSIQIETKDAVTNSIIDPQAFVIDAEHKEQLDAFMDKLDGFLNQYAPPQKNGKKPHNLSNFLHISANFMRKMQFFITRKAQNRQVFDFRTTEEKSRTFRNGFIKNIENILQTRKNPDVSLNDNLKNFTNFLDGNGMELVWYREPPYEAEFVNHLDGMKQDLIDDTPAEFYNTKLPVFLDLCKNLNEECPKETTDLQAKLQNFLDAPDKAKLIETIDEAKRISLELQSIDFAKSKSMRAAWVGTIDNPPLAAVSPFIQEILSVRDHLFTDNLPEDMRQKVDNYNQTHYTSEDYDLKQSKIWNICSQVPQFKKLEKSLVTQISKLKIPPEKVADLTYNDVAYLLNLSNVMKTRIIDGKDGVRIASDKEQYLKNLVKDNEAELRKSLQNYYQQKIMMRMINDGIIHNKGNAEIRKNVAAQAQIVVEKAITDMKAGKSLRGFNCHHAFSLSNIAYFEKVTGKPFTQINENIIFINDDFHDLLHMNENHVDENGKIRVEQNIAYRTKYIPAEKNIRINNRIAGYIGRAFSFSIMPKPGIKAMIDFRSFIFDKEMHQENIKLQQQLIEYRQVQKSKHSKIILPHLDLKRLREHLTALLQSAKEIALSPIQTELQKARDLDKKNQERQNNFTQAIDKTPAPKAAQVKKPLNHLTKFSLQRKKGLRK